MFKILSTYIVEKLYKMQHLEGSGTPVLYTRGYPKLKFKKIVHFSERFQNLITLKILSLRINTLIPPLFFLF
jgi:hypothetical protein